MVWQGIREANLKVKLSECCLMRVEVLFYGHYVMREEVEVDPMKTAVVQDLPGTVYAVRAFLGLASYD